MTIRSTDESVAVENSFRVLEVDLVIPQIAFALSRMPSKVANACEQQLQVFRHSEISLENGLRYNAYRPEDSL